MRYQSELSTDGWGRQIENPLNETKYLVKPQQANLKNSALKSKFYLKTKRNITLLILWMALTKPPMKKVFVVR